MSKSLNLCGGAAFGLAGLLGTVAHAEPAASDGPYGLGREALPEEIAAWNHEVMPDGTGLPEGAGSVEEGEMLFSEKCAVCHGDFAEGVGNWPPLAGGEDTLADKDPVKTVGSYWPYLSTAWDYVHRSMPYGNAQTLSDDEVYAIVAYILYSNYLVEYDFTLTKDNFLDVEMPNADGFIVDDREETEFPTFTQEPCMSDCKDEVEITMRAAVLDVTPEEESEGEDQASAEQAQEAAAGEGAAAAEPESEPLDMALVEQGEKVFRQCQACHMVGDGAKHRVGPHLNDVMGRKLGGAEDFRYSNTIVEMGESGTTWNEETLAKLLEDPMGYIKGTKMAFGGLRKEEDIAAVTEYLKSFSQ
ncbi:c-type cytochrome [Roseovarius salinarum]|uniref:c-type cytochrome n=1 Tax=Roseovarius salinarum TaxID=1981892 RepID=UPI000C34680D|nr:c-type cytochrome [Roseovarius salinarum]